MLSTFSLKLVGKQTDAEAGPQTRHPQIKSLTFYSLSNQGTDGNLKHLHF